jgi:hypothetical protein
MKPELPPEIISIFPKEIVDKINAFVPHFSNRHKSKTSPQICTYRLVPYLSTSHRDVLAMDTSGFAVVFLNKARLFRRAVILGKRRYSPQMGKDLHALQSKNIHLGGKNGMFLYDLEEFVLD